MVDTRPKMVDTHTPNLGTLSAGGFAEVTYYKRKKLVCRARRALTCPKFMDTCTKNLGTISAEGFAEGRQHKGEKSLYTGPGGPCMGPWANGPQTASGTGP